MGARASYCLRGDLLLFLLLSVPSCGSGAGVDSSAGEQGTGGSPPAEGPTGGSSSAAGNAAMDENQGGGSGGEKQPTETGGASSIGSGGAISGGASSTGSGGVASGGEPTGGSGGDEGSTGGMNNSGSGGAFMGTCTVSEPVDSAATGSGPHQVIIETNSDPGINEGTIFRPANMDGTEQYPILVWGQGGCSQNGLANETAMVEIASHGYFVVADGTPDGSGNRTMDRADLEGMGAPLIAYIDWAIEENDKPCSAYYQGLEVTKVAANGFSCGGLMAQGTVVDDRIVTWGVTSSGMAGATSSFYDLIDTPVLFIEGGPDEVAYDGGLEGYQNISEVGVPVLWFSKDIGHGGDLFQPDGGDFTKIHLAWLNWWLKNDDTSSGKGLLVGADCPYCSDPEWEVMSANVP